MEEKDERESYVIVPVVKLDSSYNMFVIMYVHLQYELWFGQY